MKGKEIREHFLEYFREKGHETVRSASLIPKHDPTLLFTNAGMVPFKTVFLGHETRSISRAASCQKCLRAGGKQSDIENVGFTARHHTFFEMLGNFSFGDYFKKDAIIFAWDLLTGRFALPKDKLWVSVFEDDDEAASLWLNHTDIGRDRIIRLGAKDNFWQMGDTGPCGPCSEIIIDQGEEVGCGRSSCAAGCDCDRFLELWNLVFMQYDRAENGSLSPLPHPSIDTGMGLERISAVLQNKHNNFDTDLFSPLIEAITGLARVPYHQDKAADTSIRVIADHIRAVTFLLSEGAMPANEGRGYVLRRIIRRAARHAKLLGVEGAFLYRLVDPVIDSFHDVYPELAIHRSHTEKVLHFEEDRFSRVLEKGLETLEELISTLKASHVAVIPGEEVFRLYDTYGFPPDLTRDTAMEKDMAIDEEGFRRAMESQKLRGKNSWGEDTTEGLSTLLTSLYGEAATTGGETLFLGYDMLDTEATVSSLIKNGEQADVLAKGEEGDVILDVTAFYGESGGQVGDQGMITTEKALVEVRDTKKTPQGVFIHQVTVKEGFLHQGERVSCMVEQDRRAAIRRNHTATHLLHAALKEVLGDHVKQAGSLVSPSRLRFDFTHFYQLGQEERDAIEDLVNGKIMDNLPLSTHVMDLQEAIDYGATALFDEKYGSTVRVVEINGFSKELCGGTHCLRTGDIGSFAILSEGSVASGVRRIEAVTGTEALGLFRRRSVELRTLAELFKTDAVIEKAGSLLQRVKDVEKEIDQMKMAGIAQDVGALAAGARMIDGIQVLVVRKDGLDQKELRSFADHLKDHLGKGIIFVASVADGQAQYVSMVAKELTERYHAGNIVKAVSALSGGRGGGKPTMAQGGTKELDLVDSALEKVYELIKT